MIDIDMTITPEEDAGQWFSTFTPCSERGQGLPAGDPPAGEGICMRPWSSKTSSLWLGSSETAGASVPAHPATKAAKARM